MAALQIKPENQKKVNDFLKELKNNNSVVEICNFFNKENDLVCKLLEKYIQIFQYRDGRIKQIKIDFLETQSNIKIYHSVKY